MKEDNNLTLDEMRSERDRIMPLPSEIRHTLTDTVLACVQCGKSARLTEAEVRAWRTVEVELGIIPYCECGGEVKIAENKIEGK